jgi:hypothetical protein
MKLITKPEPKAVAKPETKGYVYCYMCTHTVESPVIPAGKAFRVKPGQKCPRCSSALDAGYVLRLDQAA